MNYENTKSINVETVFNCMAGITFVLFIVIGTLLAANLLLRLMP